MEDEANYVYNASESRYEYCCMNMTGSALKNSRYNQINNNY